MKKLILTESNTMRFMKLANIGALSEQFVAETDKETMEETEEAVTETDDDSLEEGDMYKRDDVTETVEEAAITEAETVNVDVTELVDAILTAVSDATGVEMSIEGEPSSGVEDELGLEPEGEPGLEEPGLEEPGLEEPGLEEPGMEEPGMEEPVPGEEEEEEEVATEKFVNEVTRRVAKRLLAKLGKS
jgi:hypothetical protein